MSIELSRYYRARQDWVDRGEIIIGMGDVFQVVGFRLNSGMIYTLIKAPHEQDIQLFPVGLFYGIFETCPPYAIPQGPSTAVITAV